MALRTMLTGVSDTCIPSHENNQVVRTLEAAKRLGFNTLRVWAFCDGNGQWQALQVAPGILDNQASSRLLGQLIFCDEFLHHSSKNTSFVLPARAARCCTAYWPCSKLPLDVRTCVHAAKFFW